MRIMIIPDIHGRKFWREAIKKYSNKVDKVIFLGDYLDPYPYEITENRKLMECSNFGDSESLLKMLDNIVSLKKENPDKYVLLTGNHTDSYIWPNFVSATRTDNLNYDKYHKYLIDNLEYFKLVHIEGNVIFSHAGITKSWAERFLSKYMEYDDSALQTDLVKECAEVLADTPLSEFNIHYVQGISELSFYRGGYANTGSCEWADVREFGDDAEVSNSVFQVFGHTQITRPYISKHFTCLDCRKAFILKGHEITECKL